MVMRKHQRYFPVCKHQSGELCCFAALCRAFSLTSILACPCAWLPAWLPACLPVRIGTLLSLALSLLPSFYPVHAADELLPHFVTVANGDVDLPTVQVRCKHRPLGHLSFNFSFEQ